MEHEGVNRKVFSKRLARVFLQQESLKTPPSCPADGLQVGFRSYSLTRMKEEARKKLLWEQVELVEVLEARVKQLQAGSRSVVLRGGVPMARARGGHGLPPIPLPEAAGRGRPAPRLGGSGTCPPSRWMEKLHQEKQVKHRYLQRLRARLSGAPGGRGAEGAALPGPGGSSTVVPEKRPGRKKVQPPASTGQRAPREGPKPEEPPGAQFPTPVAAPVEAKRDRNVQLSLLAYLDACAFLGQPDRAQRCLAFYHRTPARQKLLDRRMYNLVMHAHAKQGSLGQVGFVFRMLEEAGLKPNRDSYVAALSCMGRSQAHPRVIHSCLDQLKTDGYSLEDLFPRGSYQEDEQEMVLRAVRAILPAFQPPPAAACKRETCPSPLLQAFYAPGSPVSYPKLDFTARDLRERFQRQLATELGTTVAIKSVEKKPVSERTVQARELLGALRSRWQAALLHSFRESKLRLEASHSGQLSLYPFLCVMPEEKYVDILMQVLLSLPPTGESLTVLARELGGKIYARFLAQKNIRSRLVDKIQGLYERYVQLLAKDTQPDDLLPREYWERLAAEAGCGLSSLASKGYPWPPSLLVELGIHLVELLVQALKVESNLLMPAVEPKLIPVAYHIYSFRGSWQVGFLRLHPIVNRLLSEAADTTLIFEASALPMCCPPVPWVSAQFGAYVASPTKLMRFLDGTTQHQQALDRCPRGNLFPVLDALNQLGNCPWKINGPVLDLVVSIFNDKGDERLDVPPPPSEAPQPARHLLGKEGAPTKAEARREAAQCHKKAAEMYSLRMDALYKLSIAAHLKGRVFWFPHNMDFRGRTYPCPPHLHHLGNDLTRAILLFAQGRPLGPRGLDWLKIHLVNLTGLRKRSSLAQRLAFANEILEEVLDSADQPLTGRKWWMSADEPWQALACAMEIARAVRSPDPEAYVSHFPVHQDGSCNGLQHYAALGRDLDGASSVNLTPCDVPQDVYSVVAQRVEAFRKRDAQEGVPVAQVLEGFISRKVVKQTVMTVVYGVTRYGGRLQIEKRLKQIEDFPQKYVWEASHYLVQQVFNSLREMFSGTREIQAWLTSCAQLIAKSGQVVEWVTPLGLPIVQPYHRARSLVLKTSMQTVNLKLSHDINQKPNTMKQKNAFPPNFIHSLDSTHMMLTALHCHRRGLMFVSVHDCYWTHAMSVDVMNQVCREQFVKLHQQPILEELSQFMLQKYCACPQKDTRKKNVMELMALLSDIPPKGDFDLEKVKESTYFFS